MVSLVGLLLVAAPAAAGGGGGGHCGGFGSGQKVVMRDNCFDKVAFSAQPGADVLVVNEGGQSHSYTAVDGSLDTGLLKPGATAHITLGSAGIVQVYCTLHGTASGDGMSGVVVVGEPALTGAASGGVSAEAKGAIDQQSIQLAAEVAARAAGQAELKTELAAIRQQVDTLQTGRLSGATLLGLLGSVLGAGALAAVYYRRRPAKAGQH